MERLYTEVLPKKVVTGLKLKLKIENDEDRRELDDYFDQYSNVATFSARKMQEIRKSYEILPSEKIGDVSSPEKGLCASCEKETELRYKKLKGGNKICGPCYYAEFGKRMIRKKFVPTKDRAVDNELNVRNVGKISRTHYHRAVMDAEETLDALDKQRKEKLRRMKFDENRLKKFSEMLKDSSKRIELPLESGRRSIRYIHKEDEGKGLRGWTLRDIQSKVRDLEKKIERRRKSLMNQNPEFKGTRIRLSNNTVFDLNSDQVRITLWKAKWYKFIAKDIVNKNSREYILGKLSKLRPNKYGIIIRKKKKNGVYEYFLQYPIEEDVPKRELDSVMGIDIGLNKLAAFSVFKLSDTQKPVMVRIYRNKLRSMKISDRKHRYLLRGKHNKSRKIGNIRSLSRRVDLYLHEVSSDIVKRADYLNAKIAMEYLKDMRIKSKARQRKAEKYLLSLSDYTKLRKLIEYKAHRIGIPTILVDPEYTSRTCSKCKSVNTSRPTQAIFKCNDCGVELNADYNASVNIAQKALNNMQIK